MREKHPLAGKKVKLHIALPDNEEQRNSPGVVKLKDTVFEIEDWWENVSGSSWINGIGNPACMKYGIRAGISDLPTDNEVVYGKIDNVGHLIHQSEIGETIE